MNGLGDWGPSRCRLDVGFAGGAKFVYVGLVMSYGRGELVEGSTSQVAGEVEDGLVVFRCWDLLGIESLWFQC